MQKARLIGIGYLLVCGLIFGMVAQGWLAPRAPLAIFPTPVPQPTATPDPSRTVVVEVVYSTEKKQWLETAVDQWLATNPTVNGQAIQVQLRGAGSQEMVAQLEQGRIKPVVVSPASSSQIKQINTASIEGAPDRASNSQPLVFTPLVVIAWDASSGPGSELQSQADVWPAIHDLAVDHYTSRSFLFSQTQPSESNSGLQAFILMAYAYHNKTSGLTVNDIQDDGFRRWMREYAQNIERFGPSTGTLIQDMIRFGPSRYSAIAAYESTALEYMDNASNRWGELQLIYPAANLWSDHPFAILDAPWVTPDQREAAQLLRDYLLSTEQQTAARQLGFRPVDSSIDLNGPDSPFTRYQEYGVQTQINTLVEEPAADVITALLELWDELAPQVRR